MAASVAACLEMHGITKSPSTSRKNRIARLVCPFLYSKPLATIRKHLWHERHAVGLTLVVQYAKDFVARLHLNPVAYLVLLRFHGTTTHWDIEPSVNRRYRASIHDRMA